MVSLSLCHGLVPLATVLRRVAGQQHTAMVVRRVATGTRTLLVSSWILTCPSAVRRIVVWIQLKSYISYCSKMATN